MSEPLLKAILRLFAVVAKEDEVTQQEREQIKFFLEEHLSRSAVDSYLTTFDEYIQHLPAKSGELLADLKHVEQLCKEVSPDLTQKQKVIIILELISIIQRSEEHTSELQSH